MKTFNQIPGYGGSPRPQGPQAKPQQNCKHHHTHVYYMFRKLPIDEQAAVYNYWNDNVWYCQNVYKTFECFVVKHKKIIAAFNEKI